ncbi:MAG: sugar phosphate isomerase/epimerase [Cytophagales bacterium]|nr:MAG: sugar phosphate isomerase/epimerase [Cytophagales bacterium]
MKTEKSRRQFISTLGLASVAATLPSGFLLSCIGEKKDENTANQADSTAINQTQMPIRASKIAWGCSIITWGDQTAQGIKEVGELGFKGIQLRSNSYKAYGDKIPELKALLDQYQLALPVFSSGNVEIDAAKEKETIEMHVNHAKFISQLGGKYLQLTNNARPKDRQPTTAELLRLAKVMNEIGKRTNDVGISAVYHNHMAQLGETPEEVDIIMDACNPQYVNLLLDIAHYFQGGGDPAKAVMYYKEIMKVVHIKDVGDLEKEGKPSYQFVELGQGKMNLPELFDALEEVKFDGWVIDELDGIPQGVTRNALECHQSNKKYIAEVLKYQI